MGSIKVLGEFVSSENRAFKWRIGRLLASSLSGFIAGLLVAGIVFFTLFDFALKY